MPPSGISNIYQGTAVPGVRRAAASLTAKQFRAVKRAAATTVEAADLHSTPLGILHGTPESGDLAIVAVQGVARLKYGAAFATAPVFVRPDANGDMIACRVQGERYCAIATIEGSSGDIKDGIAQLGQYSVSLDAGEQSASVTGDVTYTPAQLLYGHVLHAGGDAKAGTTPTAVELVAAALDRDQKSFTSMVHNTAAGALTITAGDGVTLKRNEGAADAALANGQSAELRFVRMSATTVTCFYTIFV